MTKIIITTVVGLIAATLVGVWYFRGIDTDMAGVEQKMVPDTVAPLANPDQIKGKDSITSLVQLGKSMECTFFFSSEGVKGEGTGFFDKGNARVDSLYTNTDSAPTASYMITDAVNNMMYTWTLDNGVAQGVKMAIPQDGDIPTTTPSVPAPEASVTPDTAVEYDCKPWTVDGSVFVPPTDVEFMDMTSLQQQMEAMQMNMDM
ncbi:MAG: hypothetical protein V4606_02590 [Patescibacteria group bacterium]